MLSAKRFSKASIPLVFAAALLTLTGCSNVAVGPSGEPVSKVTIVDYKGHPLNCVTWKDYNGAEGKTCDFVEYHQKYTSPESE